MVTQAFVRACRPKRDLCAHKGDFGRAVLVCGSIGYLGAARLAASACARSGAGLMTLLIPETLYPTAAAACPPEIMVRPVPDDNTGHFVASSWDAVSEAIRSADAVLIGCGLGRAEETLSLTRRLLSQRQKPIVLDADGLSALQDHILVQQSVVQPNAPLILTPHDGEFARLGGDATSPDRAQAARSVARAREAIVVRKGHRTLTATPEGLTYENTSGNWGMAKGGSGDVLAGILTGFWAQFTARADLWPHMTPAKLTACAVYLHGLAGDLAARRLGPQGMTPSDLIRFLPMALRIWG